MTSRGLRSRGDGRHDGGGSGAVLPLEYFVSDLGHVTSGHVLADRKYADTAHAILSWMSGAGGGASAADVVRCVDIGWCSSSLEHAHAASRLRALAAKGEEAPSAASRTTAAATAAGGHGGHHPRLRGKRDVQRWLDGVPSPEPPRKCASGPPLVLYPEAPRQPPPPPSLAEAAAVKAAEEEAEAAASATAAAAAAAAASFPFSATWPPLPLPAAPPPPPPPQRLLTLNESVVASVRAGSHEQGGGGGAVLERSVEEAGAAEVGAVSAASLLLPSAQPSPAQQPAARRRSRRPRPPSFVSSARFVGRRQGYYYSMGPEGLGYYVDPGRTARIRAFVEASAAAEAAAAAAGDADSLAEYKPSPSPSPLSQQQSAEVEPPDPHPTEAEVLPGMTVSEIKYVDLVNGKASIQRANEWLREELAAKGAQPPRAFFDGITGEMFVDPLLAPPLEVSFEYETLEVLQACDPEELTDNETVLRSALVKAGVYDSSGGLKVRKAWVHRHRGLRRNDELRERMDRWRKTEALAIANCERMRLDAEEAAGQAIAEAVEEAMALVRVRAYHAMYGVKGGDGDVADVAAERRLWERKRQCVVDGDERWARRAERRGARGPATREQHIRDCVLVHDLLQRLAPVCEQVGLDETVFGKRRVWHVLEQARELFLIPPDTPDYLLLLQTPELLRRCSALREQHLSVAPHSAAWREDEFSDSFASEDEKPSPCAAASPVVPPPPSPPPPRTAPAAEPAATRPGAAMRRWRRDQSARRRTCCRVDRVRSKRGRPLWYDKAGVSVPPPGESPFDRGLHAREAAQSPAGRVSYAASLLLSSSGWEGSPRRVTCCPRRVFPVAALVLVVYAAVRGKAAWGGRGGRAAGERPPLAQVLAQQHPAVSPAAHALPCGVAGALEVRARGLGWGDPAPPVAARPHTVGRAEGRRRRSSPSPTPPLSALRRQRRGKASAEEVEACLGRAIALRDSRSVRSKRPSTTPHLPPV